MTRLTDLDAILLSGAAQRDTGSLLPIPETVSGAAARVAKAIGGLLKHGLVAERATSDKLAVYRTDGDIAYGLYITEAGNAAIGVTDGTGGDGGDGNIAPFPVSPVSPDTVRVTKASTVLALLGRAEGATLAELIAATGWLPHTTRAALTGLRKKGHGLEKFRRDEQTCYRIAGAA